MKYNFFQELKLYHQLLPKKYPNYLKITKTTQNYPNYPKLPKLPKNFFLIISTLLFPILTFTDNGTSVLLLKAKAAAVTAINATMHDIIIAIIRPFDNPFFYLHKI